MTKLKEEIQKQADVAIFNVLNAIKGDLSSAGFKNIKFSHIPKGNMDFGDLEANVEYNSHKYLLHFSHTGYCYQFQEAFQSQSAETLAKYISKM